MLLTALFCSLCKRNKEELEEASACHFIVGCKMGQILQGASIVHQAAYQGKLGLGRVDSTFASRHTLLL